MHKKILYVDMDGVISDFNAGILQMFPEMKQIQNADTATGRLKELIREKAPHLYANLPLIAGVEKAIAILNQHYDIYILSTPMWSLPESYTDKRIWLEEVFGEVLHKKLILTHNKGLLKGDYLIDDRRTHGVEGFEGEHIYFGKTGFDNWKKVLLYLSRKDNWQMPNELNR